MSILMGIICPEAIIVSSDTMITDTYSGGKSYEDKISIVKFKVSTILVAQAGSAAITNRIVEKMQEKATFTAIQSVTDVTHIAEESVREVKDHMKDDDQKEHLKQSGASLLLAFYANRKPYLYNIDPFLCVSHPAKLHYATAGVGSTLANYLLGEFAAPEATGGIAIATSIYVIHKVKEHNAYCGGKTKVKMVIPMTQSTGGFQYICKALEIEDSTVNALEKNLVKLDMKTKTTRNKQVLSILQQAAPKASLVEDNEQETE
jgi:20S proteasome alpha/beta subunit